MWQERKPLRSPVRSTLQKPQSACAQLFTLPVLKQQYDELEIQFIGPVSRDTMSEVSSNNRKHIYLHVCDRLWD